MIENLDHHPEIGDEFTTDRNLRLVVESLDKNRIEKVHIYIPENYFENEDEPDEDEE